MTKQGEYEYLLNNVNTYSNPSDLKITDMRFVDIVGAPMHCTLMKIYTNQGLVGYGEIRDGSSKTYALMLKSRLLGENPCNIDRIFRRIKQFGNHSRQAGGVCGIELALWDLAGKAYGIPIYQMLGGKFRDKIRVYCDTDVKGKNTGIAMGNALKKRMELGYTFLKMDLGIRLLADVPGALSAPLGFMDEFNERRENLRKAASNYKEYAGNSAEERTRLELEYRSARNRAYEINNLAHPFTGIRITEKGFEFLEQYVAEVRSIIGYEVPLAIDHIGHIGLNDCIKLARRVDKYNLAWLEDMLPWHYTEDYVRLSNACSTPICTGEDIYLKENFRPLIESGGISVVHPDILSSGGILETKKIGDMAQDNGVAMALHMAESPIAALACAHSVASTENFLVLEFHSTECPWWDDIVNGPSKPIVNNGYITVPDGPGLGIESLNDELIAEHIHPNIPGLWESTDEWNHEWSHDRTWS